MRWIIPVIIIGLVGGVLDKVTELSKVWCFLIGVAVFILLLFVKSIFVTIKVMRQTKGAKKVWIDQNNNIIKTR